MAARGNRMRWSLAVVALIAALPGAAQRAPNGRPYLSQPLVTSTYTADPAAHVFGGRIYVYASHDVPGPPLSDEPPFQKSEGNSFRMTDFVVLSMDRPGGPVTVHSNILDIKDVPWAARQMWAPDAAYKDGTYYLYFPAKDRAGAFRIGVATSASPTGPFTARSQPIKGSYSIDPAVFIDDDGTAYLFFGGINGGQLHKHVGGVFNPDGPLTDPRGPRERGFMPQVARLTRWWIFYADSQLSGGQTPLRNVKLTELFWNGDTIRTIDPFGK